MKKLLPYLLLLTFNAACKSQPAIDQHIRLNQLGFYPKAPKIAIVIAGTEANDFYVIATNKKDTVFKGSLSAEMASTNSSLHTRSADFSALQKTGTYFISIKGMPDSYPFIINNKANYAAAVASLKGYYYQRVSMPLDKKYAGKWARAAGHPDTAVLVHASAATAQRPAGTVIASPGGWYDAGDYNKYIVNSGISMGTLLSAYEDFSTYFDTLKTNIPESGNKVPDILNEVIYNLRWMLTMQDPNDGGVYNKCTNAAFDGMVMPGVTKLPRYVVQKGTAATLDFAAVTAQAARILKKFDKQLPGLSDSCLKAAAYAWQWAVKNPDLAYAQDQVNKQFDPKITTGGYGDRSFKDEWFWAACELFAATTDEHYFNALSKNVYDPLTLPNWGNVHTLGVYTLIRAQHRFGQFNAGIDSLKKMVVKYADGYLQNVSANAFKTVMGQTKRDFNWGSNSNAANQGILLINAYLITHDKKYIDNALSNLDYILGRNATGFCFVTGIGSKSMMNPHHRQSVSDGIIDPVPGLLAGGPNPGRQDGCHYDFLEPETCYADLSCSYASNEIAINWNAPLVYLANAMEAINN